MVWWKTVSFGILVDDGPSLNSNARLTPRITDAILIFNLTPLLLRLECSSASIQRVETGCHFDNTLSVILSLFDFITPFNRFFIDFDFTIDILRIYIVVIVFVILRGNCRAGSRMLLHFKLNSALIFITTRSHYTLIYYSIFTISPLEITKHQMIVTSS